MKRQWARLWQAWLPISLMLAGIAIPILISNPYSRAGWLCALGAVLVLGGGLYHSTTRPASSSRSPLTITFDERCCVKSVSGEPVVLIAVTSPPNAGQTVDEVKVFADVTGEHRVVSKDRNMKWAGETPEARSVSPGEHRHMNLVHMKDGWCYFRFWSGDERLESGEYRAKMRMTAKDKDALSYEMRFSCSDSAIKVVQPPILIAR